MSENITQILIKEHKTEGFVHEKITPEWNKVTEKLENAEDIWYLDQRYKYTHVW